MQTLELVKLELEEISSEGLKEIDGGWQDGDGICPDWWWKGPFPWPPRQFDNIINVKTVYF